MLGLLGPHKFKDCPKKAKVIANMMMDPLLQMEGNIKEDLLNSLANSPQHILAILMTKKVPSMLYRYSAISKNTKRLPIS